MSSYRVSLRPWTDSVFEKRGVDDPAHLGDLHGSVGVLRFTGHGNKQERRNAPHAEYRRKPFFLVHIHLIYADLPGIFFGQRLHNRPHHPAGTAPRSVKIDYGRQIALVFPFRIGAEVINPLLEFRCRQFDCFHSMLFFSRRRLPAEAAMPNISATAVPILAFRIVFMARLYSITQKSEISYAPATPGTVNDEPAVFPATYPARAVNAVPYAACMQSDYRSDAVRTQFGCSLATVNAALYTGRLQLGCRSEAIPPQLMRLGMRSEYRHKRI